MRVSTRNGTIAAAVGLALVLSACGANGDDGGGGQATAGGTVVIGGCNPQNPLVPANTQEVCGGDPLDVVFSKLIRYDPETAEQVYEVADSIESEDNVTWTVRLKPGWTFHDGTPITAQSFVRAWNWAAYGPNANLNSYFFDPIAGFAEVQGVDEDEDGTVTDDEAPVAEMSGLAVVDELTFTIELSYPYATFPQRLGYLAFSPLPEVFYEDIEAFGNRPIGSGPFRVEAWEQNVAIEMTAYDGYQGETTPHIEALTYRIYQESEAEYADLLSDNVDVMIDLPPAFLAGEQHRIDLGENVVEREAGVIQTLTFAPESVDETMSNVDLRKGISRAINRSLITQNIFQGSFEAATGWVSPVVDGFQDNQCGEFCEYDAAAARQLVDESGFTGDLTLTYNADSNHKDWTEAVCNSIRNATSLECTATPIVDFATFRTQITEREMPGMFRTGWQMDYPGIDNFLVPLYGTDQGANDGDYSNPEFDAKVQEAAQAPSQEDAIRLYQEAEVMLTQEMPVIPLWYQKTIAGFSTKVSDVNLTPFGTLDVFSIYVNE